MICPQCNGEKAVKIFPRTHRVTGEIICDIPCYRCEETGEVPDIQAQWIELGKKRREDRISRRVTLKDEAARLQVIATDLSFAEQGMIDPQRIEYDLSLRI